MKEVTLKIKTLEDLSNEEVETLIPLYSEQILNATMEYMKEKAEGLNKNEHIRIEDFMINVAEKMSEQGLLNTAQMIVMFVHLEWFIKTAAKKIDEHGIYVFEDKEKNNENN